MTIEIELAPLPITLAEQSKDNQRKPGYDPFLAPSEWAIAHLVTEDDSPVDNIFSEKQQRLLTEPLKSSWTGPGAGRSFLAFANVGLFYGTTPSVVVPDVMLSLDVTLPKDIWERSHRSYMLWRYRKPPDVVIEIVSNQEGGEDTEKLNIYANIRVPYYIIYDPHEELGQGVLRVYEWHGGIYDELPATWMPHVGLGVMLWTGTYEDREETWLRWCDEHGVVIPTGKERADQERQEKEREQQEKEHALLIADQERQEKERALLIADQERQEKERALLIADQERQEKEHALLIADQERQEKEREWKEKEHVLTHLETERREKEQALADLEAERQEKERLVARLRALGIPIE